MTRALVTQMLEVLESGLAYVENEANQLTTREYKTAIWSARDYLATDPSGDRAGLIAGLRGSAARLREEDCGAIADEMMEAADMLEADAQQRSKPHGHCMHIKCREIWVAYLGSLQKLSKYEPGATMHLNKEP